MGKHFSFNIWSIFEMGRRIEMIDLGISVWEYEQGIFKGDTYTLVIYYRAKLDYAPDTRSKNANSIQISSLWPISPENWLKTLDSQLNFQTRKLVCSDLVLQN